CPTVSHRVTLLLTDTHPKSCESERESSTGARQGRLTSKVPSMLEAHKLTLARIQKIVRDRVPKLYGDGLGLWLQVSRQGHVSWLYRFTPKGKRPRAMGLGSLREVGLAEARRKAREAREQLTKGVDPLDRPKIAKSFKQAYNEFLKTWPKR